MMLLATLVLLMSVYFAQLILTVDNLDKQKVEIAHLILGFLFGLSNNVVGYYFLSSKSSREKTEMMRDIILPTDVRQLSRIRDEEEALKLQRAKAENEYNDKKEA